MKAGWEIKKLEDLIEVQNGYAFKSNEYSEDGHFVMRIGNVQNGLISLADPKFVNLQPDSSLSRFELFENDMLVSLTGNVGRVGVIENKHLPAVLNQRVARIRPIQKAKANREFLLHFLTSHLFREELSGAGHGAAQQNVSTKDLLKISIPLPPLSEQAHIVGILDEAFASIATAKANTQKNLENAKAVFESHLNSVFSNRGEGWVEKKLGEVCVVERGSSPRPIKNFFTTAHTGVNWIKIGDTEEGGKYITKTAQKITPEGATHSRAVSVGDFILTNSMSFGRPYIMKINGYIHDGWFVLRLGSNIDADYFYHLLSSKFVQEQFANLASGSVVKNISGDLVKQAVLPIPSIEQQQKLVVRFEEVSHETSRLTSLYSQKLSALEDLKKSLLHQAFTGKL